MSRASKPWQALPLSDRTVEVLQVTCNDCRLTESVRLPHDTPDAEAVEHFPGWETHLDGRPNRCPACAKARAATAVETGGQDENDDRPETPAERAASAAEALRRIQGRPRTIN